MPGLAKRDERLEFFDHGLPADWGVGFLVDEHIKDGQGLALLARPAFRLGLVETRRGRQRAAEFDNFTEDLDRPLETGRIEQRHAGPTGKESGGLGHRIFTEFLR